MDGDVRMQGRIMVWTWYILFVGIGHVSYSLCFLLAHLL
jgi:hypothetical protein